ncbi:hypothetical protein JTE90_029579 [Oedothorax gibbosus]|uniref:Thyroid transcription factor 1-associated protein 26 n=1 Tax=Oedothorax gibbosus TaxID=931172 RepID=A0AAV6VCT3_9ARAC|nr:hypothetical protein JTE90_029579 [Oedothorax gibbosus]
MPKPKQDVKKATWEKKKTAIVRKYNKVQGRARKYNVSGSNEQENNHSKTAFFDKAMVEYEKRKAYREEKKQIREAKQKEKDEKTKKYMEKKQENFKKLSARTKWGQPVMKGRMEILLERIQKSVDSSVIK